MRPFEIFLFALAIRVLVLIVHYEVSLASGQAGFSIWAVDDRFYFATATTGADWLRAGEWARWSTIEFAYPRWLAVVFAITGPNLLLGQLVNAIIGASTAALVSACSRRITGNNFVGSAAGLLVATYPSHVYHSTQLLKDALTTLIGVAAVQCFVAWRQSGRSRTLTISLIFFSILMQLRLYAAIALELAGVAALLMPTGGKGRLTKMVELGAWLLGTGLASLAVGHDVWGAEVLGFDIAGIRRDVYSKGEAAVGLDLEPKPGPGLHPYGYLALAWLLSFTHTILAPFPWQAVRDTTWALGALDATFCGVIIVAAAVSLANDVRRRSVTDETVLIAAFAVAMLAAIATFSDNIGANVRLRLLPHTLLTIPAARSLTAVRLFRHVLERLTSSGAQSNTDRVPNT